MKNNVLLNNSCKCVFVLQMRAREVVDEVKSKLPVTGFATDNDSESINGSENSESPKGSENDDLDRNCQGLSARFYTVAKLIFLETCNISKLHTQKSKICIWAYMLYRDEFLPPERKAF